MLEIKRKFEEEKNALQKEMDKLIRKEQGEILNKGGVRNRISFGLKN